MQNTNDSNQLNKLCPLAIFSQIDLNIKIKLIIMGVKLKRKEIKKLKANKLWVCFDRAMSLKDAIDMQCNGTYKYINIDNLCEKAIQ